MYSYLDGYNDIKVNKDAATKSLMLAAGNGHCQVVRNLVDIGVSVNAVCGNTTALAIAAQNKHVDVVNFLMDVGADVNLPRHGATPLMLAMQSRGNDTIVKQLFAADNDIENRLLIQPNGLTTLMCAAMGGYFFPGIHLVNNALINDSIEQFELFRKDSSLNNVWTYAAINGNHQFIRDILMPRYRFENSLFIFIRSNNITGLQDFFNTLSKNNTSDAFLKIINKVDNIGFTPLMMSVILGNPIITRMLLEAGAFPDVLDNTGRHALIYSSACGSLDCIKELVDANTRVTWTDMKQMTALHYAAKNGHSDSLKYLVNLIKEREISSTGFNRLAMPVRKDGYYIVMDYNYITESMKKESTHFTNTNMHSSRVYWNLPHPLRDNLNDPDANSLTMLTHAGKNGHIECVRVLLDAKMDLGEHSTDIDLSIMHVAEAGHINIGKLLLERMSFRKSYIHHGAKTLEYAVKGGKLAFVKMLLECGVKTNSITHIHLAAERGHSEILSYFLEETTKLKSSTNDLNFRPGFLSAAENGHFTCVLEYIKLGLLKFENKLSYAEELFSAVCRAISNCHLNIVKFLMDNYHSNILNSIHDTAEPVINAACLNNAPIEMLKYLLEMNAYNDGNYHDLNLATPLVIACRTGNAKHSKVLIEKEANLNEKNERSALLHAAIGRNHSCIAIVLAAERHIGADFYDDIHHCAFKYLVKIGDKQCVAVFLANSVFLWQWYSDHLSYEPYRILEPFPGVQFWNYSQIRNDVDKCKQTTEANRLLSCLLTGSIPPGEFMFDQSQRSPFFHALTIGDVNVAVYLFANLYLTENDYRDLPRNVHLHRMISVDHSVGQAARNVMHYFFTQPWPLSTLSLLTVSSLLTAATNGTPSPRLPLVRRLGIPILFQRKLAFTEFLSRLCPNNWHLITCGIWFPSKTEDLIKVANNLRDRWREYLELCKNQDCECGGRLLQFKKKSTM